MFAVLCLYVLLLLLLPFFGVINDDDDDDDRALVAVSHTLHSTRERSAGERSRKRLSWKLPT